MKKLVLILLVLMLGGCAWGKYSRQPDVGMKGGGRAYEENHGNGNGDYGDQEHEHGGHH